MHTAVIVAVLGLLACSANGHAVLTNPTAWNSNPSKTSPCGGGTATQVTKTFKSGSTASITWNVIAGDGIGQLTAKLDPTGGTSFTTNLVVSGSGAAPATTGTFTADITFPNIQAATATLQVFSSSGWYSCATIALATTVPTVPPTLGPCEMLVGLTFCSELNGMNVNPMPAGKSPVTVDSELRTTHDSYLANSKVFKPASDDCSENYRKFLCASTFFPCGAAVTATACSSECYLSNLTCNLQSEHANLYVCTDMDATSDIYGTCSAASSISYSAALVGAGLAAVAALAY